MNRQDVYKPGAACQVHWAYGSLWLAVYNTRTMQVKMMERQWFKRLQAKGRHTFRVQVFEGKQDDRTE